MAVYRRLNDFTEADLRELIENAPQVTLYAPNGTWRGKLIAHDDRTYYLAVDEKTKWFIHIHPVNHTSVIYHDGIDKTE